MSIDRTDSSEWPQSMFWSLDCSIASLVIAAVKDDFIWNSYKPHDVSEKKWKKIGATILAGMQPIVDCEPFTEHGEELDAAWQLLGKWLLCLWN